MEGTFSSFPANYVTLKDLQERWIKRKQDEENEEKLRRLRAEEETKKAHKEAEAKNHQAKSENRTRSARKSYSSPTAPASHPQGQKKRAGGEWEQRNLANKGKANGFNANEGKAKKANEFNANEGKAEKAIDAKSETSMAIDGRRRSKKRQSARSRIRASESDSMEEIAGKRKEKERRGFQIAREDRADEIHRTVADLWISHSQGQKNGAGGGWKQRNLANEGKANDFNANEGKAKKANEFNANEGKAIDAKSETSPAIDGRRRSKKRQSAISRIPARVSDSMVEIAGKRKEKERNGFQIARGDRTEEIRRKVADLSIASGGNWRGGRISWGGDDRRRRGGGTARYSAPAAGMVWVRKTTEG
ncbi:transcriptional regulator ATRX homolog [Dendrobium catenatum]|uniref:transcriptional regulator ATRX homolog n=1 Tax=Dendrobium catenatum TaxID=906689 RepID=UPI0010A059BB|nr:transcriptional regulator ATRX homolog [Dendrobium catenatum]